MPTIFCPRVQVWWNLSNLWGAGPRYSRPTGGPSPVLFQSNPQWWCLFYAEGRHSGDYGHHMGIHWNVACASIEIQNICNLFWALEAICHWILVAAQYCSLIKKYGYTVEYWIFLTAQKGYLRRVLFVQGLFSKSFRGAETGQFGLISENFYPF